MAAETLTATRAKAGFPVAANGPAGDVKVAIGNITIAANVEDGDIFEMCKVPAGAAVFGGWIDAADLDTGIEALDMDVGWAANGNESADPDGLGNFGVWTGDTDTLKPEVANHLIFGGTLLSAGPQLFTAETTIQVEANAAATTFASGPMTCVVLYTMDPNYSNG